MREWVSAWWAIGTLASCAVIEDDAPVPCPREAACFGTGPAGFGFQGRPQWDGTCVSGEFVLGPGGVVAGVDAPDVPLEGAGWLPAPYGFDLCLAGEGCYACESEGFDPGAAGAPGSSGSRCTGSPDSCRSVSPGSCSSIRGCRLHFRVRWNGSLDEECTGSANGCDSIHDAENCNQQGCEWAP